MGCVSNHHSWSDPESGTSGCFASFPQQNHHTKLVKPQATPHLSLIFIPKLLKPQLLLPFSQHLSTTTSNHLLSPPGRHPEARALRHPQRRPGGGAEEQKGRDEEIRHDHGGADEGHIVQDPGL